MKGSRLQNILEDYGFYDVILFVIEHLRKLEDLLKRKLTPDEMYSEIDLCLGFLGMNKEKTSSDLGG